MATSYIRNMTPEHKQAWIDALRSGDYEQGHGNFYANGKYCCLGVLTDITPDLSLANSGFWCLEDDILGNLVDVSIWKLNDREEKTFNEIADILEAEG